MTFILCWLSIGAGHADEGESERLHRELASLAQRNAWSGVERAFVRLEALGIPLTLDDYLLGAQAARSEGNVLLAVERLEQALATVGTGVMATSAEGETINRMLAGLTTSYGYVSMTVYTPTSGELHPDQMPFIPEAQQAIRFAAKRVGKDRRFMGMLPIGIYQLRADDASEAFEVRAQVPMVHVRLGEPATSGSSQ